MNNQTALQKLLYFFFTRIIIGTLVVGCAVALVENVGRYLLDKTLITAEVKDAVIMVGEIAIALSAYILLFRSYEKRAISELSLATFWKYAGMGFLVGIILQSLVILVMYLTGDYFILHINAILFLLPGFIAALTAGFVAEILIRGIIFRLTEEKFGTVIALIISVLLFIVMHSGSKGATVLSVISTAIQAGILFSAVFVFTRSLWPSIFLHFAWDLAEPGIYGGVNPGITVEKVLFISKITGSELLTGGRFGPGHSLQAAIFCIITGLIFLWFAYKKNNFIKPYWKRKIGPVER